jgi:ABC-2 type transport system ATP-binding protein
MRQNRRDFVRGLGAAAGAVTLGSVPASAAAPPEGGYEVQRADVTVRSFDGTRIETTIFEPKADGEYPAVMATHGWGGSRDQNFGEGEDYASRGYVLLTFDSRGFGESGGNVGVDGPKEVRDVSALIDHLADHPKVRTEDPDGEDPVVGMFGGSYAGGIQLNAAAHDDRLDALVPEICWHDLNYALQPNGVVKTVWGLGLYGVGIGGSRQHEAESGDVRGLRQGLDTAVHRGIAEGLALNDFSQGTESYFAVRSPGHQLEAIAETSAPALFIQGWTDHLFVPNQAIWNYEGLRERGLETKLLFYNEGHEQIPVDGEYTQTVDISDEARRAWLDVHLKRGRVAAKGRKRLRSLLPDDVTYYSAQDEVNRSADAIPPSGATTHSVPLGASETVPGVQGESVVANGPATSNSYVLKDSYDGPATSVDFDIPATELGASEDGDRIEVLGAPHLDLNVRPLGDEAFLFVKPYHVRADGTATHINDLVTPLRVMAGPQGAGQVQEVSLELLAFHRYLQPGDSLRLTVAGADTGYNFSRRSAGAAVGHDSVLTVPTRPDPTA